MRRLLLYSVGLCLLMIAPIAGIVLIGRASPIPDRLTMLHLTDCQIPCWIGIVPGKTTIAQARAYIDAVYGASPKYRVEFYAKDPSVVVPDFSIYTKSGPDGVASIRISADSSGVIAWIDINFFDASGKPLGVPPTAGELHRLLGPPSREVIYRTADQNHLLYGSTAEGLLVGLEEYGRWSSPIYGVELFGTSQIYSMETCPWHGFGRPKTLFGANSVITQGC